MPHLRKHFTVSSDHSTFHLMATIQRQSILISLLFLLGVGSCRSKQQKYPSIQTFASKTDSFLVAQKKGYPGVELIEAYHIVLSDSLDKELQHLFGQGKLAKYYNFDNLHQPMVYERKGDTVLLKKLFLVSNRNYRVLPDSVLFCQDTLFIKESGRRLSNDGSFHGLRFEEMFYKLKVSKDFRQIRDYNFTHQFSKG
jgi:hypothetical protein